MKSIYFVYPQAKKRAMTFSYDDGRVFDRRLVKIFKDHGMKGTFHLNSGKFGTDGYIDASEVHDLYEGMEVAVHGVAHDFLTELAPEQLVREIWNDRLNLEALTDGIVDGMSYAYGVYSDDVITRLESLGIKYSRTVGNTRNFQIPERFMTWNPTCHHNDDLLGLLERFNASPAYRHMPLFYIWGHSYEFDNNNNWEHIEEFCDAAAGNPDVWYCTNHEIYDYVTAMRHAVFSADGQILNNRSNIDLWLLVDGEPVCAKPGITRL